MRFQRDPVPGVHVVAAGCDLVGAALHRLGRVVKAGSLCTGIGGLDQQGYAALCELVPALVEEAAA